MAVVDGILENSVLLMASIVAIFTKQCNLILPIAVTGCIVGNVLLFQPAFMFGNSNPEVNYNPNTTNTTIISNLLSQYRNEGDDINAQNKDIFYNKTSDTSSTTPLLSYEIQGFIFTVISGIGLGINEQFCTPILFRKNIPFVVIFFWSSLGCLPLSTAIFLIYLYFEPHGMFFSVTSTDIALEFLLITCRIASTFLLMRAVTYITPYDVAIVLPLAIVILFVVQKTILKDIQPGPSNWLEIFGLVIILISSLVPAGIYFVNIMIILLYKFNMNIAIIGTVNIFTQLFDIIICQGIYNM